MTKFQIAIQNVPDKMLSRMFGVSRPSVRRWKSGQNAPHPFMQEAVFEKLEELTYGHRKFGN